MPSGRLGMNTSPAASRCPICRGRAEWNANPWRPFCSERCHLTDLGGWAAEWYRVPGRSLTTPADLEDPEDDSPEGRPLR